MIATIQTDAQHLNDKSYNVTQVREDFPILKRKIQNKPLVYLDNAASAHKPKKVIASIERFLSQNYSNVHRGIHTLSMEATTLFEEARDKVKNFINAPTSSEIVFTRGVTEGINLIAQSYGRAFLKTGDEVLISEMEHHSNIVPWQLLCEQTGAKLVVAHINTKGEIDLDDFRNKLGPKTKLVSVVHISNSLGTINPIEEIIELAHQNQSLVVIDGAQAAPHLPIDVQTLDCDFYVFSGHKMYGPTGIGVLYAKPEWFEKMTPYHGGGEMIENVTFEKSTFKQAPAKFEAGTPNISGAIGLGSAIDYLQSFDRNLILKHERDILYYGTQQLLSINSLQMIGTAAKKANVLSFHIPNIHPHDISTLLDQNGIATRAGHHCTQPVMKKFNVTATTRASLAMYTTRDEIDCLISGLQSAMKILG